MDRLHLSLLEEDANNTLACHLLSIPQLERGLNVVLVGSVFVEIRSQSGDFAVLASWHLAAELAAPTGPSLPSSQFSKQGARRAAVVRFFLISSFSCHFSGS